LKTAWQNSTFMQCVNIYTLAVKGLRVIDCMIIFSIICSAI